MGFFILLENSAFANWFAESSWAYPLVLTSHALGMAFLVGVALIISIRVLGYPASIPIVSLDKLVPIAWSGFALNFFSGLILFAPMAVRFLTNIVFQVKIGLIIAGGISLWLLMKGVMHESGQPAGEGVMTLQNRIVAALALIFWLGAIISGRIVAYIK